MTAPDVVVVGGGAAGAALAARLSEDPERRVLLLEAGPAPLALSAIPPELLDAGRVPGAREGDPLSWWYPAQLQPGRDWAVSRGRVLGGSTATNGAYFIRPRRADLDRWSGGTGAWAWDRVLPLLRSIERDLDLGASAVHGDAGPIPVRRGALTHPAAEAFVAGALAAGFPVEPDKNDEGAPGVGPVPSNAADGVRWSAATAYLLPAIGRPNLAVRGDRPVDAVLVRNGRAVGVRTGDEIVHAGAVVLAAGALASPRLLLRSGVRAAGIGAAFGDHPQVVVEWLPPAVGPRPQGSWMGAALTAVSTGGDPSGDLEVLQSLRPLPELTGGSAPAAAPLPLLVSVHTPASTGTLDERRIAYGYLADEPGRRRMREAVRVAVEVVQRARGALVGLDPDVVRDDGALDGWISGRLGTALHTCGTVPFRLPDGSPGPVDEEGRVHGVDGLRVADTSILPTAPLRGPAVAAVLTGELVAAAIRRGG